jgi:hypothetical protein
MNMRKLLDAVLLTGTAAPKGYDFLRDLVVISEGANDRYLQMFSFFGASAPIKEEIQWAREVFKREDRVMWYLRWARIRLLADQVIVHKTTPEADTPNPAEKVLQKAAGDLANRTGQSVNDVIRASNKTDSAAWRRTMKHFASMFEIIPEMNDVQFGFETPDAIVAGLTAIEKKAAEAEGKHVPATEEDESAEKIIDFGDGYAWWNLNRPSCGVEGESMGHCGNTATPKKGDRVLSLRRRMSRGSKVVDYPCLTFILRKDNYLGEMKGRANEKPAERYHKYIIPLLMSNFVEGIIGGGYQPEKNFSMNDLPEKTREEMFAKKPGLSEERTIEHSLSVLNDYLGQRMYYENSVVVCWEGKRDDIPGGKYLDALNSLIDDVEAGDDISKNFDLYGVLQTMSERGMSLLGKKFGFKVPHAYDGVFVGKVTRFLKSSKPAMSFFGKASKDSVKGITKPEIEDFVRQWLYYFYETEYVEGIDLDLRVPDDVLDGYYKLTMSSSWAVFMAEQIEAKEGGDNEDEDDDDDDDSFDDGEGITADNFKGEDGFFRGHYSTPTISEVISYPESYESFHEDANAMRILGIIDDMVDRKSRRGKNPKKGLATSADDEFRVGEIAAQVEDMLMHGERPSKGEEDDQTGDLFK